MSYADRADLLSLVLDTAQSLDIRVLVGVLKTDMNSAISSIADTLSWLRNRSLLADLLQALSRLFFTAAFVYPHDSSRPQSTCSGSSNCSLPGLT